MPDKVPSESRKVHHKPWVQNPSFVEKNLPSNSLNQIIADKGEAWVGDLSD